MTQTIDWFIEKNKNSEKISFRLSCETNHSIKRFDTISQTLNKINKWMKWKANEKQTYD